MPDSVVRRADAGSVERFKTSLCRHNCATRGVATPDTSLDFPTKRAWHLSCTAVLPRMLRTVLIVSLLAGCAEEGFPVAHRAVDASAETIVDEDTAPDVAPEASQLFGTCAADKDCGGDNAVCITTFPGGLCTHRCEGTAECSIDGRVGKCVANVCLPACGPGVTCTAYNAGCLQRASGIMLPISNYCAPACLGADRTPADHAKCIPGTVCEEHTNRCVPVKGTMGAANGGACRDNEHCLGGDCLLASEGYPEGYCRSLGLLPVTWGLRCRRGAPDTSSRPTNARARDSGRRTAAAQRGSSASPHDSRRFLRSLPTSRGLQ